jgi:hypothetical protein
MAEQKVFVLTKLKKSLNERKLEKSDPCRLNAIQFNPRNSNITSSATQQQQLSKSQIYFSLFRSFHRIRSNFCLYVLCVIALVPDDPL